MEKIDRDDLFNATRLVNMARLNGVVVTVTVRILLHMTATKGDFGSLNGIQSRPEPSERPFDIRIWY